MVLNSLSNQLQSIVVKTPCEEKIRDRFVKRLKEGDFTKDENSNSHFCAYFAAYDPKKRKVFIGHHKKSGLWLFNGGHIDKGESLNKSIGREMKEEWGSNFIFSKLPKPSLLSITEINEEKVSCKTHYDLWYFIPLDSETFVPNGDDMEKEFFEAGWKTMMESRKLVKQTNTLLALKVVEKLFY